MTEALKTAAAGWSGYPYQTIKSAAAILACSTSKIYELLKDKKLEARRLNGKTVIATSSLVAMLEQAKPWEPARHRVKKANEVRLGKLATAPSKR